MRFLLVFCLLAGYSLLAANLPPVVSNVTAAQRTDGSKIVDIFYDVIDAENDSLTVSLEISANGGTTYTVIPSLTNLTGDHGSGILPGNGKHIIWNAGAETEVFDADNYVFKVTAQDGTTTIPESFILVTGGIFNNGTSDVTISSFYLDKYELTQAGYQSVMGTNPASGNGLGENYPVYYVCWFNAIEYCNRRSMQDALTPCYSYSTYGTNPDNWPGGWYSSSTNHTNVNCNWTANGYRLPTEMEWMFAAKGGNQSHGYTYSGSNDINAVAWYSGNAGSTTHTVGSKTANELGIYDMSGNVWEWTWDIYASYPTGDQTNPTGAASGSDRMRRGGGWSNSADLCNVYVRHNGGATDSGDNIGFRICRSMDNFVLVQGGTFSNGTSNVTVSSFYLDKYELTQTGYQAVMGTDPAYFSNVVNAPVEQVSWFNAIEYCNRRSMQEGYTPCYSYGAYGTNPLPGQWIGTL
jgi:formylglycine-generating enzyme required for sulfatase activity